MKKRPNRWRIWLPVALLVVLAGIGAWVYASQQKASKSTTVTPQTKQPPSTNEPSPGTAGNPGDDAKSEAGGAAASATPTPQAPAQGGTVTLSNVTGTNRGGGTVRAVAQVTGASNGTCTLIVNSQTATGDIVYSGSYYSCSVNLSGLSGDGPFTGTLSAKSASGSTSTNYTVNF
jgi:hypothetical protein